MCFSLNIYCLVPSTYSFGILIILCYHVYHEYSRSIVHVFGHFHLKHGAIKTDLEHSLYEDITTSVCVDHFKATFNDQTQFRSFLFDIGIVCSLSA